MEVGAKKKVREQSTESMPEHEGDTILFRGGEDSGILVRRAL